MTNIPKFKLIIALLILNLLGCSTPPKTVPDEGSVVAEFPTMSVGDTWVVLAHHDKYGTATFTYKVTSVESDGSFDISNENDRDKKRRFIHFESTATGVHMIVGIQFDPEGLQFPLFVGKTWRTEVDAPSVDGDYFTYSSKYVVEEYTTVKTDVGVFEAFPIKANTQNIDTNWRGLSRYWYAPAAKAIVKSTHRHIRGIKLLKMDLVDKENSGLKIKTEKSTTSDELRPKKTYILIESVEQIYEDGQPKFTTNPGDILEVIRVKTCISGSGTCWQVRNTKTGETGFRRADALKQRHTVYEEKVGSISDSSQYEQPALSDDVTGTYTSTITGNIQALNIVGRNPEVKLIQKGKKVSGTYGNTRGTIWGEIWGEIEDGSIKFKYEISWGGFGSGEWTVEPDSGEIIGKWIDRGGSGKWNLTRIK